MTPATDDPKNNRHTENTELLRETTQFKQLPDRVRGWVTDSPLASAQFAQFFRDGGVIKPETGEALASYRERVPPEIAINPSYYPLVNLGGKSTEYQEGRLFAMMAHEIGHHSINSRTHPFTSTTREQNVQYRAEHEGQTVLNAFKIFDELRDKDDSFRPRYDSVGYGSDLQIAVLYQNWRKNQDETATVRGVASIVLSTRDSRTTQGLDTVPDYNKDGTVTNAERFMRDWDRSQELKQNGPRGKESPSDTHQEPRASDGTPARHCDSTGLNHADHVFLEGIRDKTAAEFVQHGLSCTPDQLDCLAGCMAAEARRGGLAQVDHVVLSRHDNGEIGRHLFAVEGALNDPANLRAHVATQQAMATPAAESLRQFEAVTQQTSQQQALVANQQSASIDRGPTRQM